MYCRVRFELHKGMSKIIIPVSFVKLVVTALWFSLFLARREITFEVATFRGSLLLAPPMKFYPLLSGGRYFRNLTVVDLSVKLKGNSKRISAKLLSPLWAQSKDLGEETLLTGVLITRTSATQRIYIKSCKKYTLSSKMKNWFSAVLLFLDRSQKKIKMYVTWFSSDGIKIMIFFQLTAKTYPVRFIYSK